MPRVTEEYRDERRVAIIRAASTCFGKRGFRATHMRDVARLAGLSTGAVYTYFPSKEDLFKAMLEWHRPKEQAIEATVLEGATALRRLESLLENSAHRAASNVPQARRNFRDYGEAAEVPILASELGRDLSRLIDLVADIVREAQSDGTINRDLDPHATATVLTPQIVALRHVRLFAGPFDAAAVAKVLTQMLGGLRETP
jgi:AcrR family transcriptional regulator